MKNIHLLPTDKASRLHYFTANKAGYYLYPNKLVVPRNPNCINQKIQITSDEEIKEGDWFISSGLVWKVNRNVNLINPEKDKKIILTTDQDLIADGVQAIGDDFLEWFVKNPSCEEVEVTTYHVKGDISGKLHYKIIIPKEEAKKVGEYQQELFSYLHDLGVTALQSEMQEIERIVLNMQQEQDKKLYSELVDLLERLTTIYKEDSDLHQKYDKQRLNLIEQFKKK